MMLCLFFLGLLSIVHAQNLTGHAEFDPFSTSSRCPVACDNELTAWALYKDASELDYCNKTVLFELNIYNNLKPSAPIRSCSTQENRSISKLLKRQQLVPDTIANDTLSTFDSRNSTSDLVILSRSTDNSSPNSGTNIASVTKALADHLKERQNGEASYLFSKSGDTIVAVYAGSQIDMKSVGPVIQAFAKRISDQSFRQAAVQLCHEDSISTQMFGIFVDTHNDVNAAKEALRKWNEASCIADSWGSVETWADAPLAVIPGSEVLIGPDTSDNQGTLDKRATCKYTQAVAGDGCWALADRCKITEKQLKDYNKNPNLCDNNNIKVGQYICCSAGDLPDFTPQPNPDGTCKTYSVKSGDFCSTIAEKNQMTVKNIEDRNKKTWGWAGCALIPGQVICLSTGSPPMPGVVDNAVCGPQVPGTKKPSNMDTLASLNPCPLKACCNVWGQCGTTKDFCIKAPADTGAPGTSQPGANSCIYNCGMDIVNNGSPPAQFIRLGYFEGWNANRPCLHMRPRQIDTKTYSHIHYAFGQISTNFDVRIDEADMFREFKALTGVKKIMSFGGWSFSTERDTAPIFRSGVTAAQRQTFANNVVKFINDNNLDGVDFDWEYPGAPDIPGIPPGSPSDGPNYLEFLKIVRNALPKSKTVAIAAPASFWYLKGFPIEEIGKVVDYIVYMTYDIHGQWDYGNKFSSEGCPAGDCLRSHVNKTETLNGLAMITKAGVPANKILVGLALYGRSFRMTTPGCWGPDCRFTGPASGATKGRCTDTAGYISNFEIREIISNKAGVQVLQDNADGDIIVYDNNQWVSYLSKAKYDSRISWVKGLNFGGTSDWAIDLDADYGNNDGPGGGDSGSGPVLIDPEIYSSANPTISCYPQCTFVFPPMTLARPTTITLRPETISFEVNWATTRTSGGAVITDKASSFTRTVITHPPITTSVLSVWDVTWSGDKSVITLTPSVEVPPMTMTYTSSGTSTTTNGLPIIFTYSPGPWPPIPPTTTPPGGMPTPPIPPPPPPPAPFPPTVTVRPGSPKPLCKSKCGSPCKRNCDPGNNHRCIGICGCIGPFCPKPPSCPLCPPSGPGCIGPGCSDGGGGGGGGGGGNPNDPSSCRTRTTVSSCDVECTVRKLPSTTTTTCDDPECGRPITACSTTGTTKTTTTTVSCGAAASFPSFNGNDQVPSLGDGEWGGILIPGDFGNMPPKPSTSNKPPASSTKPINNGPALPTFAPGKGNPYCFRDHNQNGQYKKFGPSGEELVKRTCNNDDVLSPGNSFGFASVGADNLLVAVTWAKDTSGCAAKKDVPMRDWCEDTFELILMNCDILVSSDYYGGAFVESNSDYGCVEWWMGTSPSTASAVRLFTVPEERNNDTISVTSTQQQKVVKEFLDKMSLELPRMRREVQRPNGTRLDFEWKRK